LVISVVVPVLDGRPWLDEQLEALCAQELDGPWEVVVADNGSTDGSVELVRSWSERFGNLRLVDASRIPGPAGARNIGASTASGELLAFCDADDVVRPGWLSACVAALAEADVVAGTFDMCSLNGSAPGTPQPAATEQLGFLPAGLASNLAVSRRAFEEGGGFDEGLHVGEDIDFCWRLQLSGMRFAVAQGAVVSKREHERLVRVFTRAVAYGRSGPVLYRRYRSAGARRQLRGWVRSVGWLVVATLRLGDRDVRRRWVRAAGMRLGRLVGSVEQRVFFP
jgi:glycosyltransferase involved in cell wall biosynthesis